MTTTKEPPSSIRPHNHHHISNNNNGATNTAITKKTTITSVTKSVGTLAVLGFVIITTLWNRRLMITQLHSESSTVVLQSRNVTSPLIISPPIMLSQEDEELPHVVYDNLKYRRVCAKSYESILCMIIRYPFEVPLQNPNVTFASPIDERFYNLTGSILLDGDVLDDCRRQRRRDKKESLAARVYNCLENEALRQANDTVVLALFTRSSPSSSSSSSNAHDAATNDDVDDAEFYGTQSWIQQKRLHDYYHDHDILVVGDSLAPFVIHSLAKQLTTCRHQGELIKQTTRGLSSNPLFYSCSSPNIICSSSSSSLDYFDGNNASSSSCHRLIKQQQQQQQNDNNDNNNKNISPTITLQMLAYKPATVYYKPKLFLSIQTMKGTKPFVEHFRASTLFMRPILLGTTTTNISNSSSNNKEQQQQQHRRPLALIFVFPIAWTQTHLSIVRHFERVKRNQQWMIQLMVNVTTAEARRELQQLGYELTSVMALDGFPQHFPSDTGAYFEIRPYNETAYYSYPGWTPDKLGIRCRGPLPPSSALKGINEMDRQFFMQYGMDMKYYANTWEFTNQFWWENGDCTHPRSKDSGASRLIMYFLQNMIDGYYESQQQQQQQQK